MSAVRYALLNKYKMGTCMSTCKRVAGVPQAAPPSSASSTAGDDKGPSRGYIKKRRGSVRGTTNSDATTTTCDHNTSSIKLIPSAYMHCPESQVSAEAGGQAGSPVVPPVVHPKDDATRDRLRHMVDQVTLLQGED